VALWQTIQAKMTSKAKQPLSASQRRAIAAKLERRKARDSWAVMKLMVPCEKKEKKDQNTR